MTKLRCAVIGVGYLGKFHVDKYISLPDAELVAICDTNLDRCNEIAKPYKLKTYTDHTELLDKVDAVSIASPTSLHYNIAKDFLNHKVHVLLEKPITSTIEEARELIDIAKKNKVILQIGHLERFNPVILALKNVLKRPLFIESTRLAPFKLRGTDVNVILDLMIHDIDLIQHLVGAEISYISASGAPVLSGIIDIANARIEFINGCVANFTASRVSVVPKRRLHIFEPDAYFSGDLHNKTLSIHRKGQHEMFPGIPEIIRENLALTNNDALLSEIQAFFNSIQNNSRPVVSGEDGMHALKTAIDITEVVTHNLKKFSENHN